MNRVIQGDNLQVLKTVATESVDLVYIDPPFNTSKLQLRSNLKTVRDSLAGDRTGFQGERYRTEIVAQTGFDDHFADYWGFLKPRLEEAYRILKPTGTLYVHLDYREVHYCKVALDQIFGRENFLNEIIWAYDFGAKSKSRWPAKHDNILVYAKKAGLHFFDSEKVDREPYMAPGLAGPEKAARGKLPTDVWWHSIVGTNSKEKQNYSTQKPLGVLKRIVGASCPAGGLVVDFFAGSGTTGEAALLFGCDFLLVDENPEAIETMKRRFEGKPVTFETSPLPEYVVEYA